MQLVESNAGVQYSGSDVYRLHAGIFSSWGTQAATAANYFGRLRRYLRGMHGFTAELPELTRSRRGARR